MVMWRVVAQPNQLRDLIKFLKGELAPSALIYRSEDTTGCLLVIDPTTEDAPTVPAELIEGAPEVERVTFVDRFGE
jgi:hypothetical protein